MHCEHVRLPDGTTAIVCGRSMNKRCGWCRNSGTLLCDWKVGEGKTCDKPICATHAQHVGENKDLCPEHQVAYEQWQAQRGTA